MIFTIASGLSLIGYAFAQDPQTDAIRQRLERVRQKLQSLDEALPRVDVSEEFSLPIDYTGRPILVLGAAYQERIRYGNKGDGAFSATFVVGDPRKVIVQVPILFNDVSRFGSRGAVGLRLVKPLGDGYTVTLGRDQLVDWGGTDSYRGTFVKLDKWLSIRKNPNDSMGRLGLQLGVGNGRYAPDGSLQRKDAQGNKNPNLSQLGVFGGVTLSLSPECDLIARYISNDWVTGTTVRPKGQRVFFSAAIADAAWQAGDGPRLVMAVGYVIPLGGGK